LHAIVLLRRVKVLGRIKAGLVSGVWAFTVLVAVFGVVLKVSVVNASGTIYIRADGSIDPSGSPISTVDNVTYILTGNIASDGDGMVVERDNIVVDGAGYTVEGPMAAYLISNGVSLQNNVNVTIKNTSIKNFYYGIKISSSSNNTISRNNITASNQDGIGLWSTEYNSISGNNITNNGEGIHLESSSGTKFYHNNFVNNGVYSYDSENVWDDGYPSGGNYWSDYNGTDANHDGIGDTPYVIDANNKDNYPLMSNYVIPEFPSFLILPFFFMATLLAVIFYKRKGACAR
jgi:parallel beta-helix repeat protein